MIVVSSGLIAWEELSALHPWKRGQGHWANLDPDRWTVIWIQPKGYQWWVHHHLFGFIFLFLVRFVDFHHVTSLFTMICERERESTVISSEASLVSIENRSLQRSYCTFSTFFWLSVYRVHIPSSRTACTLIDWLDRPFEKHWVVVVMAMWSISLLLRDVE